MVSVIQLQEQCLQTKDSKKHSLQCPYMIIRPYSISARIVRTGSTVREVFTSPIYNTLVDPYRGLFEASEEVVVLHLEDVLLVVVRYGQPRRLGRHLGLRGLLLRHERRARRRLRDLDARQSRFLKEE